MGGFWNLIQGTSPSKFIESENLRPRLVFGGRSKLDADVSAILNLRDRDPELELDIDPVRYPFDPVETYEAPNLIIRINHRFILRSSLTSTLLRSRDSGSGSGSGFWIGSLSGGVIMIGGVRFPVPAPPPPPDAILARI